MLALTALAGALLPGCAGSGTPITDGQTCAAWLDGNGRDRYLAAHGLAEYDAGNTGRRPATALQVGAQMDRHCRDNPGLLIDEALRLATGGAPPAPAAEADARPEPSTNGTRRTDGAKTP
jgi:hypothetical protein